MVTKQVKGVIIPRNDTAENWSKALNFIPKKGELIVFNADSDEYEGTGTATYADGSTEDFTYESSNVVRYKFGDGIHNINVLPFATTNVDLTGYATEEWVEEYVSEHGGSGDGTTSIVYLDTEEKIGPNLELQDVYPIQDGSTLNIISKNRIKYIENSSNLDGVEVTISNSVGVKITGAATSDIENYYMDVASTSITVPGVYTISTTGTDVDDATSNKHLYTGYVLYKSGEAISDFIRIKSGSPIIVDTAEVDCDEIKIKLFINVPNGTSFNTSASKTFKTQIEYGHINTPYTTPVSETNIGVKTAYVYGRNLYSGQNRISVDKTFDLNGKSYSVYNNEIVYIKDIMSNDLSIDLVVDGNATTINVPLFTNDPFTFIYSGLEEGYMNNIMIIYGHTDYEVYEPFRVSNMNSDIEGNFDISNLEYPYAFLALTDSNYALRIKYDPALSREWVEKQLNNININAVGEKTSEGGEIFNDYENNKALTPYASSFGNSTQAGACGYHFTGLEYAEDLKTATILVPKHYESEGTVYNVTSIGYVNGDIVNIDANSHQYEIFRITNIDSTSSDAHRITFEQVKRIETFGYNKYSWEVVDIDNSTLKLASDSLTDNWVWCTKKPNVGFPIPAFIGNISAGKNNKALGYSAVALGRDNTAVGNHSTVFGRRNSAVGYVSLATGFETIALGEQSVALGKQTVASGKRSMAINFCAKALGINSFAGGNSCITEEDAENSFAFGNGSHACFTNGIALGDHAYTRKDLDSHIVLGRYNRMTTDYTTDDTIFAIGNGADQNSRSNAFEIKEDGRAYVNNGTEKLTTETDVDTILQPYKIGTFTSDGSILFSGTQGTVKDGGIGLGYQSTTTGVHSITFGMYNSATGRATVAGGEHCNATAIHTIALGLLNNASHEDSVTIGSKLISTAKNQTLIGHYPGSDITSDVSFAVGIGEGSVGTPTVTRTGLKIYKDGRTEIYKCGDTPKSVVTKEYVDNKIVFGKELPEESDYADAPEGTIYFQYVE